MERDSIVVVCMKIEHGPHLIHTTARCHVCAAVVAISAATLKMVLRELATSVMRLQEGVEYSAICRECYVQTDMVGKVMTPSDEQIREIFLALRDDAGGGVMREALTWWGYRHESGSVLVKRFFGPDDLIDARESGFCRAVVGPIEAETRAVAEQKILALLDRARA